ncbi:hypothetical protein P4S81_19745 [Pseudoalteromonas sp. B28]
MKSNIKLIITACFFIWFIGDSNANNAKSNFDLDGNGLYDDFERNLLLDFLGNQYPEIKADYDTNNDGKVTVLEQTTGRLPLSLRIPKRAIDSTIKVTWALNLFPEWLMSAYFQEDTEIGNVINHSSRGTITANATQAKLSLQPSKTRKNNGVEFAENSGQYLIMLRSARC